jgi:hypothetical protein
MQFTLLNKHLVLLQCSESAGIKKWQGCYGQFKCVAPCKNKQMQTKVWSRKTYQGVLHHINVHNHFASMLNKFAVDKTNRPSNQMSTFLPKIYISIKNTRPISWWTKKNPYSCIIPCMIHLSLEGYICIITCYLRHQVIMTKNKERYILNCVSVWQWVRQWSTFRAPKQDDQEINSTRILTKF